MEYEIVYSKRKTLAITVKDMQVIVRAPLGLRRSRIAKFVKDNESWITKQLEKMALRKQAEESFSAADIKALKNEARRYFNDKVQQYSHIMGLKYGRISITSAKTRFGSCSASGNICFSYRLMTYPEAAREYVVVHELAHLLEMNHSPRVYAIVERYMPDYKERKKLLKQ